MRDQTINYEQEITQFQDLPVKYNERRITDICCAIIGVIFGLIMFILACVLLNKNNLEEANFPTDNKGNICLLNTDPSDGQIYPFLYFAGPSNPLENRRCVKDCPTSVKLPQCGFGNCSMGVYANHPDSNRLGAYCMPDNPQQREMLMNKSGLTEHWNLLWAIDYLLLGLLISSALGFAWMIAVQYCPKVMVWAALFLSIVLLIIMAVVLFINTGKALSKAPVWAIIIGVICILLIFVFLFYLIKHRRRINLSVQFIKNASLMLKQNIATFFYIPLFMILTILFGILIVFQYLSYASSTELTKDPESSLFNKLHKPWFLTLLLVIQTIWGLSFLRDAFDYCVSGCAIQWYYQQDVQCCQPFKRLFLKNFGSVVGGSFINAFLYLPGLVVNLFFDDVDFCLCNIFDMTRGDAYAYIYLTGSSYCNACRQCQYLCYRSQICKGNQSINNIYSLGARLVNAIASVLIVFLIATQNLFTGQAPPYLLLGIFFMCLFVVEYFIDIHIDVSEAILITFLAQYQIDQVGYKNMPVCRDSLKNAIHQLETIYKSKK